MGKRQPVQQPAWTNRDSALWHTCEIAADLAQGVVPPPRQQVLAAFRPQLDSDETYWAEGPFTLLEERALGDGSYMHNDGFFFATGRGGLTATAAVAAFRAAGNARRRREAEQNAIPRWIPIDHGAVFVSRYGMTMHTPSGVWPWSWPSITAAQMIERGAVHLLGDSQSGPISWIVLSDWAELAFVAWAFSQHPRHPQLLTGSWLPPGWLQWCATQPHPTRLKSPALTP